MVRTKFIGTFSGHESCSVTSEYDYSITIEPINGHVNEVGISNVWNTGVNITGTINADRNIYIPEQDFYDGSKIEGKVMMISGKIKLSYTVKGLNYLYSQPDNCVWNQQ